MKKLLGVGIVAVVLAFVGVTHGYATMYGVNFSGVYLGQYDAGSNPLLATDQLGPYAANQQNWNNAFIGGPANNGAAGTDNFTIYNNAGLVGIVMSFIHDSDIIGADGSGAIGSPFAVLYGGNVGGNDASSGRAKILASAFPWSMYDLFLYTSSALDVKLGIVSQSPSVFVDTGSFTSGNTKYYAGLTAAAGDLTINLAPGQHLYGFSLVETGGEVPEPGTWMILGGSLLGLCVGGFRRFRKK